MLKYLFGVQLNGGKFMPNILDYNKFCEDLQPIKSVKIFKKKFFHPEGLFSEQIWLTDLAS